MIEQAVKGTRCESSELSRSHGGPLEITLAIPLTL